MPKFLEIDVNLLNEPPQPLRAGMDDEKLHELSVSIRKYGVLQNLVVVPDDCRYEVVAGHRRLIASKLAGLTHVPCQVYDTLEDAKYGVMLDENTMREDLTPAEEGMQFLDLVEKCHWSMPELQVKFGRSEQYINERVRLVTDFPQVMQRVAAREMNWSQAKELMRVKNKTWLPYLIEQACDHGATARTLRQYVEQLTGRELAAVGQPAPHSAESHPLVIEPAKVRCVWCQRDDDQINIAQIAAHTYHVKDLLEFLKACGIGARVARPQSPGDGSA